MHKKPILKIKFIDLHRYDIDMTKRFEYKMLSQNFDVVIDEKKPDVVISWLFGYEHFDYDCIKIFITPENGVINPNYADVCFSTNSIPRDNCLQYTGMFNNKIFDNFLKNNKKPNLINPEHKKFCAFMYQNNKCRARNVFFKKIEKYKFVDSLSTVMPNAKISLPNGIKCNDWMDEQLYIYDNYKFVIAFENSSAPGYVSEKILQSLLAGAIPIYWGADDVGQYFNPESFINVNDFDSFADCIEYIKKVDNDDGLYQKHINAQSILPNSKIYDMTYQKLAEELYPKLEYLLKNPNKKVGKIGFFGKLKYKLWLWASMKIRREKQRFLYNVNMSLWEKIKWVIMKI